MGSSRPQQSAAQVESDCPGATGRISRRKAKPTCSGIQPASRVFAAEDANPSTRTEMFVRSSRTTRVFATCAWRRTLHAAPGAPASATFDLPGIRREILDKWLREEAKKPGRPRAAAYCNFTYADGERLFHSRGSTWHFLDREMSSNVAGETGAVQIYQGALAAMGVRTAVGAPLPPDALAFAQEHRRTESEHLELMKHVVASERRTSLLPLWNVAGWLLGFAPTLVAGRAGLFATVEAVETFVEEHYVHQITTLRAEGGCDELIRLLEHCCAEEVHHKDDAANRLSEALGATDGARRGVVASTLLPAWMTVVRVGSAVAADVARRV